MDAETRLRREIQLLKRDIGTNSSGKLDGDIQSEIMRELADEEVRLRMSAMARIRAPTSLTERVVHKIGSRVGWHGILRSTLKGDDLKKLGRRLSSIYRLWRHPDIKI